MSGNVERVPVSTTSLRLQRFIGGSVAALLTANAFAVTAALDDGEDLGNLLRRPAPLGEAIQPPTHDETVISLITTAEGRTFLADPATAGGRRAIDAARDDGSTVRELPHPGAGPEADPEQGLHHPADSVGTVGSVVESTPSTVTAVVGGVGGVVESLLGALPVRLLPTPTTTTTVASSPTTTTTTAPADDPGCLLLILC